MHVVSVGEITIDNYLDRGRTYVGGISLNFAVHTRRCGATAALVSCVGDDAGGQQALAKLQREGVNASRVHTRAGATAQQDITVTAAGERIFPPGGYHAGVLADWQIDNDDLAFIQSCDIVVAPYFRQIAHIFERVMGNPAFTGRRVADLLDVSDEHNDRATLEPILARLDLAFVSGDEHTIELLRPLSYGRVIVVTLGARGSAALVEGTIVRQVAIAVPAPIDTTGCGDAFGAAFTVAYFSDGDLRRALIAGAQQAALVTQHYGASNNEHTD